MKIAVRPGEVNKKVIVKVKPTYPNQKDIGGYRVDTSTNREGGVEIPFTLYAMSSTDSDLEFYDADTGEPLGEYEPPAEVDEDSPNSMQELASAIRLLVESGFKVDNPKVDNPTKEDKDEADRILSINWKERMAAVREVDSIGVRNAIIDILKSKKNLGKTNKEILDYLEPDMEENPVIVEINDNTEDLNYNKIPKSHPRNLDEPMMSLSDL